MCYCFRDNLSLYFVGHNLSTNNLVYTLIGLSMLFEGLAVFYTARYKGL